MQGYVTTRDLITQSGVILREFGFRCYVRCWCRAVLNRGKSTFLECIAP